MRTSGRLGPISLGLVLALFSGCAQSTNLLSVFGRSGEIRGRVEILSHPASAGEFADKSSFEGREVMVFLEPLSTRFSFKLRSAVRRISIRTDRPSPAIQLVTIGQPFRIQNLDSIYHELFTANSENPLRIRLRGHSESNTMSLESPSLIQLFCALHPDENFTLVVSTGHQYAIVDSSSRFRIPHVRPGRYRIRLASKSDWSQPQTVNVRTAETVDLTLRFTPDRNG